MHSGKDLFSRRSLQVCPKGDETLRKLGLWLCLIALGATSAAAASGDEFYDRLYARGLKQCDEGNYSGCYASLKVAAFGLLEDIRRFETAQVYMTVAAMRQKHEDEARIASQRVLAAERVEKRYAALQIPDSVRSEFESAARKLLSGEQFAALRPSGAPMRPPTMQPTNPQPQPRSTDGTIIPAPQPQTSKPPAPTPRSTTPAPQPQTQPRTVQPAPVPVPVPAQPQPRPAQVQPPTQPVPQPSRPVTSSSDPLAEADRAVNGGDLASARALYRAALEAPQLTHGLALRVAEGLYRSRDFAGTMRAFERAGAIAAGEEQYHYYYAVALYEMGRYSAAKRELSAALPFIEVTPDVARYRTKIEGAIE